MYQDLLLLNKFEFSSCFDEQNSAGVVFYPYQFSEDGIEMQFANNYIEEIGINGGIVNMSSIADLGTYEEGIRCDGINGKEGLAISSSS